MSTPDLGPPGGEVQSLRRPAAVQTSQVEARIARSAVRFALALGVPLGVLATVVAGPEGALGAGVAVAVVCGMFAIPAALVSAAARYGPGGVIAATLGGLLARLLLYGVLAAVLVQVRALRGASMAIVAFGVLVPTLIYEAWVICRVPGFFWVDAGDGGPVRARAVADRRERTVP